MKCKYILAFIIILLAVTFKLREQPDLKYHILDPIRDADQGHFDPKTYPDYAPEEIKVPQLFGFPVKALATLSRIPLIGDAYVAYLVRDNRYPMVRRWAAQVPKARPMYYPYTTPTLKELQDAEKASLEKNDKLLSEEQLSKLDSPGGGGKSIILSRYYQPYKAGKTTPTEVIKRTLTAIRKTHQDSAGNRNIRAFVHFMSEKDMLAAAAASEARFKAGKPLSHLDGVPVGVKVEFEVQGLPHTSGTGFLDGNIAKEDSIAVRKLREAGAIIIGVTNMQEIGLGVQGFNAHYGSARNPHNVLHHTGGSSAGSAAAVAAGIVPVALGGDGGGSVRIPAAFCGLIGIKPTYGRITLNGGGIAATVVHVGPLAYTVADALLAYHVMSTPDPDQDHEQLLAPAPTYNGIYDTKSLKGVRIGVFKEWNGDSSVEVRKAVQDAINDLRGKGAEMVTISIPYMDIMFRAHTISILSEMAQAVEGFPLDAQYNLSWPILSTLALPRQGLHSSDYIGAQVARQWFYDTYRGLFKKHKLDAILTPTTGEVAPVIHQGGEDAKTGFFDLKQTANIMKYATLGNLIGAPAITVPRIRSPENRPQSHPAVPIAVQFMADHWNEAVLFRLALALHQPQQARDVFVRDEIV